MYAPLINQCSTTFLLLYIHAYCVQGEVKKEDLQLYVAMYNIVFQVYADKVCMHPVKKT